MTGESTMNKLYQILFFFCCSYCRLSQVNFHAINLGPCAVCVICRERKNIVCFSNRISFAEKPVCHRFRIANLFRAKPLIQSICRWINRFDSSGGKIDGCFWFSVNKNQNRPSLITCVTEKFPKRNDIQAIKSRHKI